jgi:hypothetical protein
MNCSKCGKEITPGDGFCAYCGAKADTAVAFCMACGEKIDLGAAYCRKCGKAVHGLPAGVQPIGPSAKGPKPKGGRNKKKSVLFISIACVLAAGLIVGTLLVFLPVSPASGPVTGSLKLGKEMSLADAQIGTNGGTITIDNRDSALNGMQIIVPGGAYGEEIEFEISGQEIESHTFGGLFHPATPLITVNNGHGFAAEPMTLKVPVKIEADEIAAAFYYDKDKGTLEGIPCVAQDGDSITLMTSHFSCFVITKEKIEKLDSLVRDKPLETGFKPGKDDFYAPNYGSYVRPGGHCAGQSIAEIHYYNMYGRSDRHLRQEPIVDNDQYDATKELYWDDSLGIRLCSLMQDYYSKDWYKTYDDLRYVNEDLTYYYFLYTIAMSHEPQEVSIKTADFSIGHAMVVYKISRNAIWFADPNYPGDTDRKIAVTHWLNPEKDRETAELGVYETKPRADGTIEKFTWVGYYGIYSLVNYDVVNSAWKSLLAGQDPAASIFPPHNTYKAYTNTDDQGVPIAVQLDSNTPLHVNRQELAKVNPSLNPNGDILFIQRGNQTDYGEWDFYLGDQKTTPIEYANQPGNIWYSIRLKPGVNDLGILYFRYNYNTKNSEFDNFQRFTVILDEDEEVSTSTETPAPTEAAAADFTGSWQLYTNKLLKVQGNEVTMNYINDLFNKYGNDVVMGSNIKYKSLEEYISINSKDYVRGLIEFEKKHLIITKNADGKYTVEISGYQLRTQGDKQTKVPYKEVYGQVEVSENKIIFQKPEDAVEYMGRDAFELSLDGNTLSGFMYVPFYHPYANRDDVLKTADENSTLPGMPNVETASFGVPEGYNPERVWSFEAVRVQQ